MTTEEALAIAAAAQPKPKHRQPLDKLQSGDALVKFTARVTDLSKRFNELAGDVADIRKSLDQMRADLDHIENNPGAKRRIIH